MTVSVGHFYNTALLQVTILHSNILSKSTKIKLHFDYQFNQFRNNVYFDTVFFFFYMRTRQSVAIRIQTSIRIKR